LRINIVSHHCILLLVIAWLKISGDWSVDGQFLLSSGTKAGSTAVLLCELWSKKSFMKSRSKADSETAFLLCQTLSFVIAAIIQTDGAAFEFGDLHLFARFPCPREYSRWYLCTGDA
jgi:hypothetical protein